MTLPQEFTPRSIGERWAADEAYYREHPIEFEERAIAELDMEKAAPFAADMAIPGGPLPND